MSISNVDSPVLPDGDNFNLATQHLLARAQYLEALLAAVLMHVADEDGAMVVDVVDAARRVNVVIEALDSSNALVVWDVSHADAQTIPQRDSSLSS